MKNISLLALAVLLPLSARCDPFEDGMRETFTAYKKGDNEAVTTKLRELLKIMEEKGGAQVGGLLPDKIEGWTAESVKQDDLGAVGGGVSISRLYFAGKRQVTAKVIKDSPLVKQLIPLLSNQDLIRLSNRKTYRIGSETAIMDGERKLQMVVDGRILVELTGNQDAEERDLVAVARKLDLAKLAKLK